jgi:HprK-related kinase B
MVPLPSIRDEVRRSTSGRPPAVLDFAEMRVTVHSNAPELLRRLQAYFAPFLAPSPSGARRDEVHIHALECAPPVLDVRFSEWPREPGKKRRKEEIAQIDSLRVVRKVRTDMQFICGDGEHFAFGPCLQNVNQIINFVGTRFISHYLHRGWQLCHAAGVANDTGGLAIAGLSGGGKSTLALHLMRQGLDYVSNDRVLIRQEDGETRMIGVPKLPRINPGTALHNPSLTDVLPTERVEALKRLDAEQLWDLEEKYDVDIDCAFGEDRIQMHAPLRAVVVLNWVRGGAAQARLQQVDLERRQDLLGAILKAAGPFYEPAGAGPPDGHTVDAAALLQHLREVPAYEMVGGVDFIAAIESCRELLRPGLRVSV